MMAILLLRKGNTQTSCGLLGSGSELTISFRDGNISKVHSARDSNGNSMKDNFWLVYLSGGPMGTNHIADYYLSRPKNHII